jgi:DNA-directed RNA polymerase specialized sigma24 family protein
MPANSNHFNGASPAPTENAEPGAPSASSNFEGAFDAIASGLYNLASMLLGEGEQSIQLLESVVARADESACGETDGGAGTARTWIIEGAIRTIAERNPESLAAPEGFEPAQTCIEDDDLSSAGVSRDELEQMMTGRDRDRVRNWLESLPSATRIIFVLRAVGGYSTPETAGLLAEFGGPQAANWTPDAVREFFRQGLCSLASQLIHAQNRE